MSAERPGPTTALCDYDDTHVRYRGRDLVGELLTGDRNFIDVAMEHILGRSVSPGERRVMNAVMIAIMEHGLTPSAIATRSVYMSAPENLQGAVAAGLLAVGSQFVGTIENAARLLQSLVALPDEAARREAARAIIADHKARGVRIPGFGHHLHRPDDPRAVRLLEIGREAGVAGEHVAALALLAEEVDGAAGRHVTVNATGATGALMGDMGLPVELMRGFAVISRCAGLVAHIAEERERPSGRHIWEVVDKAIPYAP